MIWNSGPVDGPKQPLSEDTTDLCPLCGGVLVHCVGVSEEEVYDGVKCQNGCDLWAHFS